MSRRRLAVALAVSLGLGAAIFLWQQAQQTSPLAVTTGNAPDAPDVNVGRKNRFLPEGATDRGWPFIRGANFDGHSPEIHLADAWPAAGPPVLWHRPLGQGYSSFTAAGNRLFTQYQTLSGQYVACLSADTGATIWEYHYDWPYEAGGLYPGPRATPTLYGGRVYFTAPSGLVGCLTWDGSLVWQVATREKFAGKGADFGYSCSPTVVDGLVILPVGGKGASMVALDARDGSTRWQGGDDSASYTPALPISVAGRKQVIGYLENALAAFDQADGRLLWRMELSQGYDEHAAWPIFVEPHLWIAAPFKWGSSLLDLSETETLPATAWHVPLLSNDVFSSVYHAGAVYGFDLKDVQAKSHRASRGVFRCLDFATGAAKWDTDQTGHCSVLIADGKLILFNDKGELIVARATPGRYEELARASVLAGEIGWTPPALDRGRLFVRNQKQAACVYIGEQSLLELDSPTRPLALSEIPQGTYYYNLAAIMGVEPEYAMDVPSAAWLEHWFSVGLAMLGAAYLAAVLTKLAARLISPQALGDSGTRRVFWGVAFVLGCIATTPLSWQRGEFVFTWPVALFVTFQMAVQQVRLGKKPSADAGSAWRERLVVLFFLIFCFVYFLLCRRLSLAFEWVFLAGFPAALLPLLASRWLALRFRWPIAIEMAGTACAFTAYFWASIALLWWKYPAGG
ncbi:MAG TPA: PQQ-binding-like beta-propeller repeat protein [Planctomycetaceae bacterium]|jgi:outer membrane protein assembly factor BamB